eukprot:gene14766-31374_t
MDISDRLEVKIIAASELQSIHGVKPNAYVEVVCGLDSQQTKHINETSNPVWNYPAMVFSQLLAAEVDTILVYLKHKDIFGSNDVPLGVAIIPLDTVYNSPKIEIEDWYPLTETSEMNDEASGRIHVILTYWNESDLEYIKPAGDQDAIGAPNVLKVSVVRANDIGGPKGHLLDTLVTVQVGDLRKDTK